MTAWSQRALGELRAAGYRRGLARTRVIDFLDAQDCCIGAQELHQELVSRGEQVGLASFEDFMPSQLSGGMKKRAAVARALALDPEILFFDEPSAGLDPIIAAGIDELILELKKAYAMSMVVVTHELASAFLIADRMLLIDRGSVIAMGAKKELADSTNPRVRQFLDRVPEPQVEDELNYLQMLTEDRKPRH